MINRLIQKHRPTLREVKIRSLPKTKYDYNDPNEKYYWKDIIEDVERKALEKAEVKRMRKWDFSTTLPPELYKRVAKLIPLQPIEEDIFTEEMRLVERSKLEEAKKLEKADTFNESNLSQILELQKEVQTIELKVEDKPNIHREVPKNNNWFSDFVEQNKKERVKWNSKLYKMEKTLLEKPLFEQAEDLMDTSAQNFADWLNSLGSDEKTNVDKEMIKQLFSMGIEEATATAVQIDPKKRPSLPNDVAVKWALPEASIEDKVEQCLKKLEDKYPRRISIMQLDTKLSKAMAEKRKKNRRAKKEQKPDSKKKVSWEQKAETNIRQKKAQLEGRPRTVAFGRTLPAKMRQWVPSEHDRAMQHDFPQELISTEALFRGIGHLRSTKALIEHYQKNPRLERPTYLIEAGAFKPSTKSVSAEVAPLYERLIIYK